MSKNKILPALIAIFFLMGISEMLPAAHHVHDTGFIKQSIKKLPFRFKKYINYNYSNTFNKNGRAAANIMLLDLNDSLSHHDLAKDDDEIIIQAKLHAKECSYKITLDFKKAYALKKRIQPPECKTELGEWKRLNDEHWWRRQLRKTHGREVEKTAIKLGMVSKSREIYCSNESLSRRQQQNQRNTHLLETLAATNENGDTYTLKELSDLTTSNPELKRNELMTRIRGFEELAKEKNHVGMFYTITCPSKFHKKTTAKNGGVYDNQKYEGATPREAQKYLASVWAKYRSCIHRMGIDFYGFRVAEPQHDGTPHWHLLLFMDISKVERATETFEQYSLQVDGGEPGAGRNRFTAIRIDPAKGTAAGYIAKYIAKNIDGYAIDCDLFGNDPIKAAARVQAWAATWGIRQFQQIGGASVTQWRNLRKMPEPEQKNTPFYEAWKNADSGDWAAFNKTVEKNPIQKLIVWSDKENKYGEAIGNQTFAYEYDNVIYPLQIHTWTIERVENDKENNNRNYGGIIGGSIDSTNGGHFRASIQVDSFLKIHQRNRGRGAHRDNVNFIYADGLMLNDVLSFDFRQAQRVPWTCVNNCTEKIKKKGGMARVTVIKAVDKSKCESCGAIEELRPYGKNGKNICFECGMKDEDTAKRMFRKRLLGNTPGGPGEYNDAT